MRLLVIVLCLLSERFLIHSVSYQRFFWFQKYCLSIQSILNKHTSQPWVLLAAIILPITLVVYLTYLMFSFIVFGLVAFILSLALFYYCLGPYNIFYPLTQNPAEEQNTLVGNYLAQANTQLFAAIFWYMIAGPIVLLIYRLSTLALNINAVSAEAKEIVDVLEWLPARMTVLLYLLVGNFQKGFSLFTGYFLSSPSNNNQMISQCGLLAVRANDADEIPLSVAESLVEHALIVLLVFIALLTLVWF